MASGSGCSLAMPTDFATVVASGFPSCVPDAAGVRGGDCIRETGGEDLGVECPDRIRSRLWGLDSREAV